MGLEDNLSNKVKEPNPDLVFCDWKDCPEIGQYVRCYFDLYKNCPKYITHQRHLKYIRGLIKKGKKRHHPRR